MSVFEAFICISLLSEIAMKDENYGLRTFNLIFKNDHDGFPSNINRAPNHHSESNECCRRQSRPRLPSRILSNRILHRVFQQPFQTAMFKYKLIYEYDNNNMVYDGIDPMV